jgi:carbamate kinase
MNKTMLLAVGGNSLIRAGEKGTIAEQLANARRTAAEIVGLIRNGYRLVITHGNGPQVGAALLRSERAASQVPGHPLDVCDASTQGEIGYLLEQALINELAAEGLRVPVVAVLTQCIVSRDDPAMTHPSKPIGPFYSRADAEERKRQLKWDIVEDAARGYRRIVPSPDPIEIVELEVIRDLVNDGVLVVVDKDRASAVLAAQLGVDLFVISTDTDFIYLDYKKPGQQPLTYVTTSELERHAQAGHFPPGNMGPKVESVLRFLRSGGKEAVITSCENLCRAVAGLAGTHILADSVPSSRQEHMEAQVGGR